MLGVICCHVLSYGNGHAFFRLADTKLLALLGAEDARGLRVEVCKDDVVQTDLAS